jgi:hypothetical protein
LIAIHAAVPGPSLLSQSTPIPNPASAQALPGEQADRDLRLVQPATVLGGVVHSEPIPQPIAGLGTKALDDRFAGVRAQVIRQYRPETRNTSTTISNQSGIANLIHFRSRSNALTFLSMR